MTMQQITITQNQTFGQIYVESSDDPSTNIRIPTHNVLGFLLSAGVKESDFPLTFSGQIASRTWAIAQQYEG